MIAVRWVSLGFLLTIYSLRLKGRSLNKEKNNDNVSISFYSPLIASLTICGFFGLESRSFFVLGT